MRVTGVLLVVGVVLLCGCSITQKVTPVSGPGIEEVCIVENPKVRASFLEVYKNALAEKGLNVRIAEPDNAVPECTVISTYRANWSWDLRLYMSYAEIKVFKGNELIGIAEYDATKGGANTNKFINAEAKVKELVDKLFVGMP